MTGLPDCASGDCDCHCVTVENTKSIMFKGAATYVELDPAWGEFAFANTDKWSVSFWYFWDDSHFNPAQDGMVISRTGYDPADPNVTGWQIWIDNTGAINAAFQSEDYGDGTDVNGRIFCQSSAGVNDAQWHHIVVAYDGHMAPDSFAMWIDAAVASTAFSGGGSLPATTIATQNVTFTIGKGVNSSGADTKFAYNLLDEPLVFANELDQDAVDFLFGKSVGDPTFPSGGCVPGLLEAKSSPTCPEGLLLWYRCGDDPLDILSVGTTNLQDWGPNSRNGTPTGWATIDYFFIGCPDPCNCTGLPNFEATGPNNLPGGSWVYDPTLPTLCVVGCNTSVTTTDGASWGAMASPSGIASGNIQCLAVEDAARSVPLEWPGTAAPPEAFDEPPLAIYGFATTNFLVWLKNAQKVMAFQNKTGGDNYFLDPANGLWDEKLTHALTSIEAVVATAYYVGDGSSDYVAVKSLGSGATEQAGWELYNASADTWTAHNNYPGAAGAGTCVAATRSTETVGANGFIHVGCGGTTSFYSWDIAAGTWSVAQSTPSGSHVFMPGSSMAVDPWTGDLWVIFWEADAHSRWELWTMDLSTKVWTLKALPPDVFDAEGQPMHIWKPKDATSGNGKFLLAVASATTSNWNLYEPTGNTWFTYRVGVEPGKTSSPRWYKTGHVATLMADSD